VGVESTQLLREALKRLPMAALEDALPFLKGAAALDPSDEGARACLQATLTLAEHARALGGTTLPPPGNVLTTTGPALASGSPAPTARAPTTSAAPPPAPEPSPQPAQAAATPAPPMVPPLVTPGALPSTLAAPAGLPPPPTPTPTTPTPPPSETPTGLLLTTDGEGGTPAFSAPETSPGGGLPARPLRLDPRFDATLLGPATGTFRAVIPASDDPPPPPPPPDLVVRPEPASLRAAALVPPYSSPALPRLVADAAHTGAPPAVPTQGLDWFGAAAPPSAPVLSIPSPPPPPLAAALPAADATEQLLSLMLPLGGTDPALVAAINAPGAPKAPAWGEGTWANLVSPGEKSPVQAPNAGLVPPAPGGAGPVAAGAHPDAAPSTAVSVALERATTAHAAGDLTQAAEAAMTAVEALMQTGRAMADAEKATLTVVAMACLGSWTNIPSAIWHPADDRPMPRVARAILAMVDGVRTFQEVLAVAQAPITEGAVVLAFLRAVGAIRIG
jgi:hypothetical protein